MELPELPPGCALDPGWADDHGRHRGGPLHGNQRSMRNQVAKRINPDPDEVAAAAVAEVLRAERVALWQKLYAKAKRCDELEREVRKLREQVRSLTAGHVTRSP